MRKLGFVLAVSLAAAALAGRASAQEVTLAYSGSDDFRAFCVTCHGATAKGDGVLASSLKKRPADLTVLAKLNDGTFPFDRIVRTVDGRQPVAGHGGKDMPAWGEAFTQSQGSQTPEAVKARIEAIVRFLERLQVK